MTTTTRKRRNYAARVPADRRRREILDAALHVVVTRGHSAATMDAVAEQAGITKPVIYGVFRNRSDLLTALLHREQRQAVRQLLAILPTATRAMTAQAAAPPAASPAEPHATTRAAPAEDWVDSVVTAFLAAVREAPQRWSCIVAPMADMPTEFHAARELSRAMVLRRTELVLDRLGAGPDRELLAHTVISLGEMAARLVLADPEHFTPRRFVAGARAAVAAITDRSRAYQ